MKFNKGILPKIEPLMKLIPIMKPTGRFMVSLINRLTLLLLELFCIPINKIKNKVMLNVKEKNIFFSESDIFIFFYLKF